MAGFDFEFTYSDTQEKIVLVCLAAARARTNKLGLSWQWRHIAPRHCVVLVNGNSRTIDLLGYRLERDLPLVAEGCAAAGVTPSQRARIGRGLVDMMLRGRDTDQEGCMVLGGVARTTYYYPPYKYDCPSSPRLHARLSITQDLLVAWNFDEIAPEVLLEELHTACELVLEELVNKRSKKLSFAQLVTSADQASLLQQMTDGAPTTQLLTELKDLRKEVRHRAAAGAHAWLTEHWEDVAICLERLVQHAN
jgi:hypothetical protein